MPNRHRVDVMGLHMDRARGLSNAERPDRRPAHHHALGNRLATVQVARARLRRSLSHAYALPVRGLLRGLSLRVPTLEPLDPATGVDQLLLARVEGVAVRADV